MTLGWMQIAAYVRYDDIGDIRHRVLELHENLKRLNMSWQEESDAKAEILRLRRVEEPDITAGQVAKEIGDNAASFSRAVAASEAMEKRPELRQSASRKSALRAADVADQMEARKRADEANRSALEEVETRIVADDAVNFLQKYDSFFDVIITDPPYGMDFWKQGQKTDSPTNLSEYDDSAKSARKLYEEMIPAMARAMRDTGWVLMFGSADSYKEMESVWVEVCKTHKTYLCQQCGSKNCYQPAVVPWIWYRPNSRNPPRFPQLHAKNMYEYILVVNMGAGLLAKPTDNVFVYEAEYGAERIHGNQKPIELIQALIACVAYPGDKFCDPCYGSGAHLAAAAASSLIAYGCDLNPGLRAPALGLVAKYFKPIPESIRGLAEARFQRRLGELTFGVTEGEAAV